MVPVTVLTGFLGSGKTTLLNRLLSDPAIKDTAVIVNEFGEIGLDHLLIESAVENTVLMKSGCICCTVRGDIVDTIEDLLARRDAGLIPGFSRIVIETTGLADPAPVVYTLATEAGETCRLDGIVTTVDAVNGLNELAQFPEAMKQVAIADRIVLTKRDLATPAEIAAIEARLGGFPAPILRQADPANLFGLASDVTVAHPHHDHASGIDSTVLEHDAPVPWPALAFWLEAITSLRGDDLLRIKGLVDITGETKPVVIHAVQHVIHPPTVLERWPAADRRTRIVVIGRALDPAGLKQAFLACLDATAGPQPSLREGQ